MVGCRDKANCPHAGPGPMGGNALRGVFLMDPSPYIRGFCSEKISQKTNDFDYFDEKKNILILQEIDVMYCYFPEN